MSIAKNVTIVARLQDKNVFKNDYYSCREAAKLRTNEPFLKQFWAEPNICLLRCI